MALPSEGWSGGAVTAKGVSLSSIINHPGTPRYLPGKAAGSAEGPPYLSARPLDAGTGRVIELAGPGLAPPSPRSGELRPSALPAAGPCLAAALLGLLDGWLLQFLLPLRPRLLQLQILPLPVLGLARLVTIRTVAHPMHRQRFGQCLGQFRPNRAVLPRAPTGHPAKGV